MKELFLNPLFVWVAGILSGFILYIIKRCMEPKQMENSVVRLKDVKKLLSEKKTTEEKNLNLVIENAKLQVRKEIADNVNLLVSENASLMDQFISEQRENYEHISIVIDHHSEKLTLHSDRLSDGDESIKGLREKLEQLRLIMVQFLPPQAIRSIIKQECQ